VNTCQLIEMQRAQGGQTTCEVMGGAGVDFLPKRYPPQRPKILVTENQIGIQQDMQGVENASN
jgi:hypothetical protein